MNYLILEIPKLMFVVGLLMENRMSNFLMTVFVYVITTFLFRRKQFRFYASNVYFFQIPLLPLDILQNNSKIVHSFDLTTPLARHDRISFPLGLIDHNAISRWNIFSSLKFSFFGSKNTGD